MAHKKNKNKSTRVTKNTKKSTDKTTQKKSSKKKKNYDKNIWKIAAIAVAVLIIAAVIFALIKNTSKKSDGCNYDIVKLDFYVMSQCPYGTQVEDAIKPVLDKMGECIDFNLNFIATENADGTFSSLHGESEAKGNIVQLCAAKYNPDKYMDMIVCQNENAGNIPGNWESCAKDSGLDTASIKKCYEGNEGKQLLSQNVLLGKAIGATGSPTIYLNDIKYSGSRESLAFQRTICAIIPKHPECLEMPACAADSDCQLSGKIGKCVSGECVFTDPVKVELLVLVDERCADCQTANTMETNKLYFPGIEERYIDYSTEEGKQLYEDYNIQYLPAYIFDGTVVETQTWKANAQLTAFFDKVNEDYVLKADAVQSTFDPVAEICENKIDDDADGKIDCDDSDCSSKIVCREEKENHLQVFIMSDCPYGRKAIEALKEVIDNFDNKINYEVHYIASEAGDGFSSLHGQYEVDEDIIQLCVLEHSPKVWFDYMYCRSTKGVKNIDWKECGNEVKVDIDAVQACFDGDEGANLLREDIKIGKDLGVSASPTWFANNKYKFSGIDAETVKTNFCTYNEKLSGCDITLSSGTGTTGSC